jgi:hypothetical protein
MTERFSERCAGLLVMVSLTAGCGNSRPTTTPSPLPPGSTSPSPLPPAGMYPISGLITAYRGGPLKNASVVQFHCNTITDPLCVTAQTDEQGRYTLSSVASGDIGAWKSGYQSVWKVGVTRQNASVDFTLYPEIVIDAHSGRFSGTLNGDEMMSGDDVTFGGLCKRVPCKFINFAVFVGQPIPVEVRLRWSDPTRRLALYHFVGDPDALLVQQPVDRFCCSSDEPISMHVSGYFDAIAVGFEEIDGHPPGLADTAAFEVTAKAVP